MPKPTPAAKPRTNDPATPAKLPEPIASPTDALQRPHVAAAYEAVDRQLIDLAELLSHARQTRQSAVIDDAIARVAQLRATLGL